MPGIHRDSQALNQNNNRDIFMRYKINKPKVLAVFLLTICSVFCVSPVWSEDTEVEPQADQILQQMSHYLASLKRFTVSSHSTIETMLDSGQKIMLDHNNISSISRPDKLFTSRNGDSVEQRFYYDGKSFTQYDSKHDFYATVNAPDNLSDALDMAQSRFNLIAPGADLLYPDSYARLSKDLLSGFYVGKVIIDGVECHHLAFRNTEVDWQIWIQTGDKPLPIRYIVTSRWITGSPQFSLSMQWNSKADFSDEIFKFVAPEKAERISILSQAAVH